MQAFTIICALLIVIGAGVLAIIWVKDCFNVVHEADVAKRRKKYINR